LPQDVAQRRHRLPRVIVGTAIRALAEALFQIVTFPLACRQAKPPAAIVDHDGDLIRMAEGRRAAIERGTTEVSLWRCGPPDEFRTIKPLCVLSIFAAWSSI
jgi:hypothetical protein